MRKIPIDTGLESPNASTVPVKKVLKVFHHCLTDLSYEEQRKI